MIIAVRYESFAVAKRKPEKKFRLERDYFSGFLFATAKDDHPSFHNNDNDDDDNDNNENDNINDKNDDKNNENGNFHSFKIFLPLSDWLKYHGQFFITS